MICTCLFLVCNCFRQTWTLLIIILIGNHRDLGGFNAYKTNEQQVFRLVFLMAESAPQTVRDQKKMTSFDKVIPNNFAEAETKDLSQFTIKNKPHLKYIRIFFFQEQLSYLPNFNHKKHIPIPFLPRRISWVSKILPPLSGSHHHLFLAEKSGKVSPINRST